MSPTLWDEAEYRLRVAEMTWALLGRTDRSNLSRAFLLPSAPTESV